MAQFVTANEKKKLSIFGVAAHIYTNGGLLTASFRVHSPSRLDEGREKEEMRYRPYGKNYDTTFLFF